MFALIELNDSVSLTVLTVAGLLSFPDAERCLDLQSNKAWKAFLNVAKLKWPDKRANGKRGVSQLDAVAPKGLPGRKKDPNKEEHAKRANQLRKMKRVPSWDEVGETVNKEFNLTGTARYNRRENGKLVHDIRYLYRHYFPRKAEKKIRG